MASKRSRKKIILRIAIITFLVIVAVVVFVTINLNRLLTNALHNGFDSNLISDVYELKFEHLEVNFLTGSLQVKNVEMFPRERPVQHYSYINSTFRLEARKMHLKNVDIIKLLRTNKLDLKQIELIEPGIDFTIEDKIPVFFPFKQSSALPKDTASKKSIESYFLEEFKMKDAYFHVSNSAKQREFNIQRINISLKDILVDHQPGKDVVSYKHFDFYVGEMAGTMQNKGIERIQFKDFKVNIDSLRLEETPDTVMYHFTDLKSSISNLDMQTADSLFHITMQCFDLSYKDKSIELENMTFKPNVSDQALQKRYTYRKENFAADIRSVRMQNVDFDSLIYARKIFIDEILLNDVEASIFKDLTKPFPPGHHPDYLGQQIKAISMPINIKRVKATKVNLVNTEVKPDGGLGRANINRVTLVVENITNQPTDKGLTIKADAYVENAAHANLQLNFSYRESQFSFQGGVDKFDFVKLNALTNSYAPARITKGEVDEITFSGNVFNTYSQGTMKFLYHDLVIDFELEDKAKWKSTILGFAANTYLNAGNPVSEDLPVRVVQFRVERDPRKGYLAMLVKSILTGIKETFIMNKENKQAYKEAKSDMKKKSKEKRKQDKN